MMSRKLRLSNYGSYNPSYANVSLLLHGDGTNGSTTITDNSPSPKTLTRNGNTQINTAVKKYGTGSIAFDGTGDYLSSAFNTAFDLLPNSFTIESWLYPIVFKAANVRIFGTGGGVVAWNATNGLHVVWALTATGGVIFQVSKATTTPVQIVTSTTVSLNTWTHVACVYNSSNNTMAVFINGVMDEAAASGVARPSTNPLMNIASLPNEAGSATIAWQGYMDDFQITKGVAKYNMSFSPPLKPYPNS